MRTCDLWNFVSYFKEIGKINLPDKGKIRICLLYNLRFTAKQPKVYSMLNTWGLMRAEGPATGERQASGVAPTWSQMVNTESD